MRHLRLKPRPFGIPSGRMMDYAAVSAGLRWFEQKKRGQLAKTIEEQACGILTL